MSLGPEHFWSALLGLYGVFSLLQVLVWWGIFGRLAFRTSPEVNPRPKSPISVLICARNEADNLRKYLPKILNQDYACPWELIMVDDASTDETPIVLADFLIKHPEKLRVLRISTKTAPGKKAALTQGILAARYESLLLTDADCEPCSRHWITQMSAVLDAKPETEIVLGYGPAKRRHSSNDHTSSAPKAWCSSQLTPYVRFETAFVAAQYFSLALIGMPYMGVGRNLAFKRQVFDRVGGFTAHLHLASGDDDLLVNAAAKAKNTAICIHPEAFMYSEAPGSWLAWLKQKQRHLTAGPAYQLKHKMVLALLALSQFGHYCAFFALIISGIKPLWVLGIFVFRQLSIQIVFGKVLRILREPGLIFSLPFYDVIQALYFGIVAPWILMRKKSAGWEGRK